MGNTVPLRQGLRAAIYGSVFVFVIGSPHEGRAQAGAACGADRTVSMLVGAGLGAAAGAIPATIVHRHDQATSHRIVVLSVSTGAVAGFLTAGRDRPCASRADSAPLTDAVMAGRTRHAGRGALSGGVIGGVLGAIGGTFYNVGCANGSCTATRAGVMLFSAGEGAVAGGLLGGLIGWAWPTGGR